MKFEFTNIEPLSDIELLDIFGGTQENPKGIFQWIGYGLGALNDSLHELAASKSQQWVLEHSK